MSKYLVTVEERITSVRQEVIEAEGVLAAEDLAERADRRGWHEVSRDEEVEIISTEKVE